MTTCTELVAGQVGYLMAQIKNLGDVHIGDTVTDALQPGHRAAARLQGAQADGLQRAVSDQQQRLRAAARSPGQAPAQRRQLHLSAGKQRRPRLRLPLRLPRHAPPRNHPAAARTRQRPGAGHHRPQRHLRNPHAARARSSSSTTRRRFPMRARSRSSASRFVQAELDAAVARTSAT